jgi:sensor histidine kinase YesM
MRKKNVRICLVLIILSFLVRGTILAQISDRDNLMTQLQKEKNDTNRVKLLLRFVRDFADSTALCEKYLSEAHNLSRSINYRYGLEECQYFSGILAARNGRYDEAIARSKRFIDVQDSMHVIQHLDGFPLFDIRKLYNESGKQTEKFQFYTEKASYYKLHGPKENMADCYHGIAGYYSSMGDYDKSIEYYLRAREVYKSFDPFGSANETGVIGKCYMEWGNLAKAEVYLKSALKELVSLGNKGYYFYCYQNLGDLYFKRQDYKTAIQFYTEAKKNAINADNLISYSFAASLAYLDLGSVSLASGFIENSRLYFDSAERIRQQKKLRISYPLGNLEIDFYYYRYFLATGNKKLAMKSLLAALHEARKSVVIPLVLKYTSELNAFLLQCGDSLQALRYLVQYQILQDSVKKMNTQARIASFEIEQQQQDKEKEIEQLKVQKATQRNYYLFAGILLLLIVSGVISRILYKRKRDQEQLTTGFQKQLAEAETKALRAQMNPHFIFNSLNSINSFVMDQKHEIASDYLIKFSKLIRLILDNSRSETISLEKELETLKLYVILEAARFDNRFKCVYKVAEDVDTTSIKIPPMLLQPFVENAIWHGLMHKEGEGNIIIEISMKNEQLSDASEQSTDNSEQFLRITITDDGIGREKAAELKSKSATHKSHGLKVTSQRIEMMNRLNSTGAKVEVVDLHDEFGNATGTRVELIIPC